MELAPVPRRRSWSRRARLLVIAVFLTPITLLVVVPALLGLHPHVVGHDATGGSVAQGSVVFESVVPVGDLEVGDVITFPAPPGSGWSGLVTHRIVAVGDGYVHTQGANAEPDPWLVPLSGSTQERVVFHVPWLGYPLLWDLGSPLWVTLGVVPLILLVALRAGGRVAGTVRRRRVHEPHLL